MAERPNSHYGQKISPGERIIRLQKKLSSYDNAGLPGIAHNIQRRLSYLTEHEGKKSTKAKGLQSNHQAFPESLHSDRVTDQLDPKAAFASIKWQIVRTEATFTVSTSIVEGRKLKRLQVGSTYQVEIERNETEKKSTKDNFPIDSVGFEVRTRNALIRSGYYSLEDIRFGLAYDLLSKVKNIGLRALKDITEKLPPSHQDTQGSRSQG